jgi:TonB-dependent starch-binding outer membrane protein SusC
MKKYKLYFLLFVMTVLSVSLLQSQTIKGVVSDAQTGETVLGAFVIIEGTSLGTTTNLDGEYSIDLEAGTYTISVSYIGYNQEARTVNLNQGETLELNFMLTVSTTVFDEVVVIGYGTQKKKVTTGAIATVSAKEITATPVLRVEQALQGRAAGVQVTNLSGQPGEPPTIRIRGAGTTGNSNPLYVVDGMVIEGGIDFLNPGDIESIDVLKDAASAAIYGARAANGVVLITTKSGKVGQMNVTFSSYYGIQNPSKMINMLDAEQYRMLMNEGARNAGLTEPFNLNEIPRHNTDWQRELFQRNAPISNHEFSVVGGGEKSTYASSMSFFSQEGIIGGDKSKYDRISARFNSSHKVNKFIRFGNNLAYSHIRSRGIASNSSFNGAYSSALNMDPLTPLFETDEEILRRYPYASEPVLTDDEGRVYGISNLVGAEIVNPLALLEIQTGRTKVDKIVGNVFGELDLMEGLTLRSTLGIDLAYVINDSYRPLFYLNDAQLNIDKTSVFKNIERYFTWQFENTLSYSKKYGDHNLNILAGTTASKFTSEDLGGFNAKVPINDPNHVYLNMATDTVWMAFGGATHWGLLSQFGRVLYDYKSRYAFSATVRRDGSSRFGPNNRYGIFPSLGASWMMSEESFFPNLGPVDIVKLRASWGVNGNDRIGLYRFISTIDQSRGYIFGSGREFGSSPAFIPNEDIRWEQSEQIDIALDFGAFNNRLTGVIDFYVKNTNGLLEIIPIPAHVGNEPPVANVGSVRNSGVELSLNWRNSKKDFNYSFGLNMGYNRNRMINIGNEEGILPGASWAVAGMVTRTEVGLPIAYFWGYQTDGVFQNTNEILSHIGSTGRPLQPNAKPGDVRFVDVNNDGVIDANDRTMIGNPTPDLTFGFDFSFDYKGFDFGILLVGTYGNDIFNGMQRQDLRFTNRTTDALDRWTGEGTSDKTPRYTWIDTNNNSRVSDLYIEDGSFLRVRNIQFGYNLSKKFLNRISSSNWRFYISAENLFTFTKYSGADPEIGALSSFDIGIDRGIYPNARAFRCGTSITF